MKFSLMVVLILYMPFTRGQEDSFPESQRNELKLNLLYLMNGTLEMTYERLIGDRTSLGVSSYIVLREGGMLFFGDAYPWNLSISPLARIYFGKTGKKGFFLEGNLMIGSDNQLLPETGFREETAWGFGFGMAYGGKWILGDNWVVEVYAGAGYTNLWDTADEAWLFKDWDWWFYPRVGVTVGKRF